MFVFLKHMKFRNQAWLCSVISDFEAHIMLKLCSEKGADVRIWRILLVQKMSALDKPPLSVDILYGRSLIVNTCLFFISTWNFGIRLGYAQ